ncbi:response regulator transcription factor [Salegentibacter sp. F188]|uniref:Response regulator transcription factor n=1 Tax=Autumnicola patrickiae TaxID=3075591 RepID=A0ABU3E1Y2_9FLAO|nr:response regulator transcription factor [Salegentibacter sp. F188]MDT0690008.1 response regulator transcription factor [Salegentibacter sp. F188]
MRILLVEDDEMLRKSLVFFLTSKKYEVSAFDNGLDAITHLESSENPTDLLITDLNLPFAAGQQVIGAAKKIVDSSIPIIVLTSSGVESTELEVFDLGADEFVTKPFSPPVLLKRIEKLLPK